MKYLLCLIALAIPVTASAATFEWDRNTDPDMDRYPVYACFTAGCIVERAVPMHQGTVPHPVEGVKATFTLDLTGKDGAIAVTAKDHAGNESGLSVSVPFSAPVAIGGMNMDLIILILGIAVLGFIVWIITTKIPMDPIFRIAIYVIVTIVLLLFIVRQFGGAVPNVIR